MDFGRRVRYQATYLESFFPRCCIKRFKVFDDGSGMSDPLSKEGSRVAIGASFSISIDLEVTTSHTSYSAGFRVLSSNLSQSK